MLIPEILENLPNDLERLLYLNELKNQLESQEKRIKENLLKTKPKHSRVQYKTKNTWVPSKEYAKSLKELDAQKKFLVEESKAKKEGTFKETPYISVVKEPQKEVKPNTSKGSTEDFKGFFLG